MASTKADLNQWDARRIADRKYKCVVDETEESKETLAWVLFSESKGKQHEIFTR